MSQRVQVDDEYPQAAVRARTDETFCLYCQLEFRSPQALADHVAEEHPNTYAYWHIVTIEGES